MVAEKKYWQINTEKLAKEIKAAAHKAVTEEDLKMSVEPLLQNVFTQMGVDVDIVQYEKAATRFKGKADAVGKAREAAKKYSDLIWARTAIRQADPYALLVLLAFYINLYYCNSN